MPRDLHSLSDGTWTNNTIGALWRHNYARTLPVVTGTSATILDGTGATTVYIKDELQRNSEKLLDPGSGARLWLAGPGRQ